MTALSKEEKHARQKAALGKDTHALDGSPLELDDRLFDLAFGTGKVVELQRDARFVVEFSSSRRKVVYTPDGKCEMFVTRTLFWHQPHIQVPPKDAKNHLVFTNICRAIAKEIPGLTVE